MSENALPSISIVVPVYNSEETLDPLVARLRAVLKDCARAFEIILVNDASGDGSWDVIRGLVNRDIGVRGLNLTRNYGHFPPSLAGPVYSREQYPSPCTLIKEQGIGLVVPMSIDWAQAPWSEELLGLGVPIFCPTGEAMRI